MRGEEEGEKHVEDESSTNDEESSEDNGGFVARQFPENEGEMPIDKNEEYVEKYDEKNDKQASSAQCEGIWSGDVEVAFQEALIKYPHYGRHKLLVHGDSQTYGRNQMIAKYIKDKTGKVRNRKQVSSHMQVVYRRNRKYLQLLKNRASPDPESINTGSSEPDNMLKESKKPVMSINSGKFNSSESKIAEQSAEKIEDASNMDLMECFIKICGYFFGHKDLIDSIILMLSYGSGGWTRPRRNRAKTRNNIMPLSEAQCATKEIVELAVKIISTLEKIRSNKGFNDEIKNELEEYIRSLYQKISNSGGDE